MGAWLDGLKVCCGGLLESGGALSWLGRLRAGTKSDPTIGIPPYVFDRPQLYVERLINTVTAIIPGNGNRAMFNRLLMNPPSNTTERSWGMQGVTEVDTGCTADFNCGAPGHGDLNGVEGTVVHMGEGTVEMAVGLMGYIFTSDCAGRIVEAISSYAFQPTASGIGSVIDRGYCFKAKTQASTGGVVTKKFSFVAEDGCGNGGIGYSEPEAGWAVKDGISAGRNADPGAGVVHAEAGFKTFDGAVRTGVSGTFTTVDGKTITVVNGIVTSIV